MNILLYRGKSMVSRAIQFQTRSPYSHCAIQLAEHEIYEAWHVGGVRRLRYAIEGHTPGTGIDIYRVDTPADFNLDKARLFLQRQVGKKYDFWSVGRFLTRRKTRHNDKWFCSELCLASLEAAGMEILHINASEASPRDVSISPHLYFSHSIG